MPTTPIQPASPWCASTDRYDQVVDQAQRWLSTPALAKVVESYDGPRPEDSSIAQLAAWSDMTLDPRFAHGHRAAHSLPTPLQQSLLLKAAKALGMLSTPLPPTCDYDTVVILGGPAKEHAARVLLAGELIDADSQGGTKTTVLLATNRRLRTLERSQIAYLGTSPTSEWEALGDQASLTLGPLRVIGETRSATDDPHLHIDRTYYSPTGPLRLLCAPAVPPHNRPDAAQAVEYLIDAMAPQALLRVLIVTSALTAPCTFFTAAPALLDHAGTHRATVEVVGTPPYNTSATLLAQKVAYELNHSLQAIARLYADRPHVPAPTIGERSRAAELSADAAQESTVSAAQPAT
jgi:hypothetical protein